MSCASRHVSAMGRSVKRRESSISISPSKQNGSLLRRVGGIRLLTESSLNWRFLPTACGASCWLNMASLAFTARSSARLDRFGRGCRSPRPRMKDWALRNGVTAKLVAPFKPKDADLYAIVQNFDETYSAYLDYQRRMERFWCLRWL